jgi:hypothetical protein
MSLLVSGCSFTWGDELKNPEQDRWSTHLGKMYNCEVDNVAMSGACNKHIWKSLKRKLLQNNNYTKCIVMWSDPNRVEVVDMHPNIQFKEDFDGRKNFSDDLFRFKTPFIQMSPARLEIIPWRYKREEMEVYYDKIHTNEAAFLDTWMYMYDVYNTCNLLGIECYGGVFHETIRFSKTKLFSLSRLQHLGPRLIRVRNDFLELDNTFNKKQRIGLRDKTENNFYYCFNEFTNENNYPVHRHLHPGKEAHKKYAEYLYEEVL